MNWPKPSLGSLVETIVPARDKPEDLGGPIPWLRIEDFGGKWIDTSSSGQGVTAETVRSMNLRVFPVGAVVCTCSCSMGTTAIVRSPLVTNQTFIGLVPRDSRLASEYLYWALQAYREELNAQATGAIQQYLSRDDFRQLRIPIPPPEVQRAIAYHLDIETARIDALIAKKRRLLDLLEERQRIVESNLVLDHSGSKVPIRWFMKLGSGEALPPGELVDEGPTPVIGGNGLMGWTQRSSVVHEPSIAVGRVGALCGNVHVVDPPAWVTDNALLIRGLHDFDRNFLAVALLASRLNEIADRTAQPLLTGEKVKALRLPLPSASEQSEILKRIGDARALDDAACSALEKQVGLLTERRQALISAAVTGELKIPGAAA